MVNKPASTWRYAEPCHLKAAYANMRIISWRLGWLLVFLYWILYLHVHLISCGYIFVAPCNARQENRPGGSIGSRGGDGGPPKQQLCRSYRMGAGDCVWGSALQPSGKATARFLLSHLFSLLQLRFCWRGLPRRRLPVDQYTCSYENVLEIKPNYIYRPCSVTLFSLYNYYLYKIIMQYVDDSILFIKLPVLATEKLAFELGNQIQAKNIKFRPIWNKLSKSWKNWPRLVS